MRRMQRNIPLNPDFLLWDFRKGINLMELVIRVNLVCEIANHQPALVILDPMYKSAFGDWNKELPARAIIDFCDLLQTAIPGVAILLIHHTTKPSFTHDGKRITEAGSYYGSQWLDAYLDVRYALNAVAAPFKDRTNLILKHSRAGECINQLILHYDFESDTVTTDVPMGEQSGYERALNFLRKCKEAKRTTHFAEVMKEIAISARQCRSVQTALLRAGVVRLDRYEDHHKVWEPT